MNTSAFFELIARFAEQPIPAILTRHVYLWVGEDDDLFFKSPLGFIKKLDLHLLCKNVSKTPIGDKAAGREFSRAIDEWLLKELPGSQRQRALLITGLDLLYRYYLPLSPFIQLASENTMVILCVSELDISFRLQKPLPSYIQFNPYSILNYAVSEVSEEGIVKEG